MGKHSKKHSRGEGSNATNNFDLSQMGNLLNMDPNQLSGLLNNVDLSQLSSMLQGMNSGSGGGSASTPQGSYDKRLELLNAMKPLVDAEKSQLIDSIIQIYNISRIMKK
jgi:hypothetical protein